MMQNAQITGSWLGFSKGTDAEYDLPFLCRFLGDGTYKVFAQSPDYSSSLGYWTPLERHGEFLVATLYKFFRLDADSRRCLNSRRGKLEVILGSAIATLNGEGGKGRFKSVKLTYDERSDLEEVFKTLWASVQEDVNLERIDAPVVVEGTFSAFKILDRSHLEDLKKFVRSPLGAQFL